MKARLQRRLRSPLALALCSFAALAQLGAQITVDASVTWQSTSPPTSQIFDASSADKLVVIATAEHGFNNTNGDITGITYDGVALTLAVERVPAVGNITHNSIWYLDNPGIVHTAGEILVSAVNREAVTAIALSNTAPGVGATAISADDSKSVDLTTTAADSLVIASHGMGGDGNTANVTSVDTVAPLVEVGAIEFGSNWGGHVSGYAPVATAGPGTHAFTGGSATGVHTIAAEFLLDTSPPDVTPPTLAGADIVDNVGGGPINEIDSLIYTVTFSEPMNAATVEIADFENGGSPPATIHSVTGTGDPAVFEVSVSPGGAGTLQLQVAAGANLEDLSDNALDTAEAIADDTTITVEGDVTAPTLAGADIVDNFGGEPVFEVQPVTYTVTFSEPMNPASVEESDFENGGTPAATITSVSATPDPAVFTVTVVSGGAGTLRLQIAAGAILTDVAGNPLDTASAIPDDTTITVNAGSPPSGTIPNQSYPANEEFEIISPQLGTRHLNQPSVFNGYAVFAGNAIHEVWNIANPYAPTIEATMTSIHASGEAESHQVTYGRDGAGSYYFAATSGRGIDIWNVTDTIRPQYVKALELPGINYGDVAGGVWGLSWQGDYIYIGATSNGLYVVDASDPANATHVATLPVSSLGGVWPGPLFALGNLLVVTTPKNRAGIATVDISDPLNPALLDSVRPGGGSYIGGFYGTHAWLIGSLRGYDVTTDPANIAHTSTATIPSSEYMSWADDHLFLGGLRGGTQGIWKYDASDPNNLVLVDRVVGRDSRWDDQFSCPVGNLLLITDDQNVGGYVGGVVAVHDTQPDTNPLTVKYVNPPNGSTGQPAGGQVGISFSEWPEFKSVDPSTFILRTPGGSAVPGTWGCTYTTVTFAPDAPLAPNTTYEIVLPAGGVTDLVGNPIAATFTSSFTTGSTGGGDPDPGGTPGFGGTDDLNPVPPVPLGTASNFSVKNPRAGDSYNWDFGDGNSDTGPSVSHTYAAPGRHSVQFEVVVGNETTLEAEDAQLSGVTVASNHAGFTGTGFGDYSGSGPSVKITWTYDSPSAVTGDLTFRYANGSGARPLNLYVNGGSAIFVNLVGTGGWAIWADLVIPGVALQAGVNTLELVADAGGTGPNVDHLRFPTPGGGGQSNTFTFTHIVHNPLTASKPTSSQPIAFEDTSVW
ncbi:MAG: PKD domain-containing protein, partial [Akkermansiaceae bacterium]|nr:PKD domain-containing protein [Akkermansiaceae bacterium]